MSLRDLPEKRLDRPQAYQGDPQSTALERWKPQAAEATDNTISIYDVIGVDWWTGEGVTRQLGLEPWASHPDDGGTSTITGTGFALVKKFRWYRRLPHYRLKAANYLRRFWWLLRKGMLTGTKPVRGNSRSR